MTAADQGLGREQLTLAVVDSVIVGETNSVRIVREKKGT